ncbi:phage late control D family protein [Paenibacillus thalictri]|uniref:Phage late control D family protein n=1 Tax=Paenibacillus thalictri TaxID=2527873 RepID=A0A4V6MSI8_9BACL|nr:contractile injection system protein, VgrG/Pvc8 family [Paenibacillus thalictri]TBL80772.1 phage late control D family protein [Paenibacillus thalictri]
MSDLKLGTDKYTFDELEKNYRNFLAPGFKLLVNNDDAVREGMAITELSVDTTASEESDTVSFTVSNAYNLVKRDFDWLGDQLALGKTLEVHMGYTDRMTPLFFGYITSIQMSFPAGGTPQLTVTGMDLSFKMMRGRHASTFANMKISDIVKQIGQKYGASSFDIDETSKPLPNFPNKPESDYQFLQTLAQTLNYEFFIVGKTLYFRKKNKNKTPLMTLSWGKHLIRFDLEQNISDQVTEVIVKSWDAKTQTVIEASSSTVDKVGSNSTTGADLLKTLGTFEETLYVNAEDAQDAQAKADAVMNERGMQLISGSAECIGLPEIRAGRYITLDGLGRRLNQPYYIKSASHRIGSDGYLTQFEVQGNAV